MGEVINAIFKNGVFKPLEKIETKDHEKVTTRILFKVVMNTNIPVYAYGTSEGKSRNHEGIRLQG